jgi:hypothetical protein
MPANPFDAIAVQAARTPTDLVIHVGDYNYRGTPGTIAVRGGGPRAVYDAGDTVPDDPQCQLDSPYVSQNAGYSEQPDAWEAWRDDFFAPAAPLLAAAPWAVVRGNHELCSRAGPGWFYFLDPGAAPALGGVGERECPPQGDDAPLPPPVLPYLVMTPPYVLDLGTLRLAMVDSANACDAHAPSITTALYTAQLDEVLADAPPDTTTWIATHRPLWVALDMTGTSLALTLQQAWAAARASQPTAPIELVVGGHVHAFQSATFAATALARPPQLVVGNSGIALDEHAPNGAFAASLDGVDADVLGLEMFGFLHVASLAADGTWSGALVDPDGDTILTCATGNLPGSLCVR